MVLVHDVQLALARPRWFPGPLGDLKMSDKPISALNEAVRDRGSI